MQTCYQGKVGMQTCVTLLHLKSSSIAMIAVAHQQAQPAALSVWQAAGVQRAHTQQLQSNSSATHTHMQLTHMQLLACFQSKGFAC
jgi:hypothetical protein